MGKNELPEKWKWIAEVIDEAHLPDLGSAVSWDSLRDVQSRIAYNPNTNTKLDVDTQEEEKPKTSPVRFIPAPPGDSMPGAQRPAAARKALYYDGRLQDHIVKEGKDVYVPCIAHGDYVRVESLETDHLQAQRKIQARQKDLVEQLNKYPDLAECVMKLPGIDKFFVKAKMTGDKEEKYYGTLFFYQLYFNDIDNLWLICSMCNRTKKDKEASEWFQEQWLYRNAFRDYLHEQSLKDRGILSKVGNQKGLAQVAIDWFWERHAHYISRTKLLQQDVVIPMKILNKEVDHLLGSGRWEEAEREQLKLEFRLKLMSKTAKMALPALEQAASKSILNPTEKKEAVEQIAEHQLKNVNEEIEKTFGQLEEKKQQGQKRKQETKEEDSPKSPRLSMTPSQQ